MTLLTKKHANQLVNALEACKEIAGKSYEFSTADGKLTPIDTFHRGVCHEAAESAKDAIRNLIITLDAFGKEPNAENLL